MSDAQLRRLERIYSQDPSAENLRRLNVQQARSGQELLRPDPDFLLRWVEEIGGYAPSEDSEDSLDNAFGAEVPCPGLGNIEIYVEIHEPTTASLRSMDRPIHRSPTVEIQLQPLHDSLSELRAWQLRAYLWDNNIQISIPRGRPVDWSLRRPFEETQIISNRFISSQELLDYLLSVYREETERGWQKLLHNKNPNQNDVINILDAAAALDRTDHLFKQKNPFIAAVIQQNWFKEDLEVFANQMENNLAGHGVRFDYESTWPMTISWEGDHYAIKVETGYNDTVDPEDFDESNPEGQHRGYVDDYVQKFGSELDRFGAEGKADYEWETEWEYWEEHDEGSEDIAISVKAEAPFTPELLKSLAIDNA